MIKRISLMSLALVCMATSAQQAAIYSTDGTRTYSLAKSYVNGKQTDNLSGTIVLKTEQANQTIDGFGYAITYSSCYNLLKMNKDDREKLLRQTYSTSDGYGVSYARISLGCNDFSSTEYSLCDTKGPDGDLLQHFRLYKDETDYVIPVLKEILAINPDLKIIAAPWTSPRWMKVKSLSNRSPHLSWTDGHLNPDMRKDYANYFVKFVQAFAAEGITINAVCPQNEPLNAGNCASLYMPWQEEADFVRELAPAFHSAGIDTKIYLFDHNYNYDGKSEEQQYPVKIYDYLKNFQFDGKELIVGAAYHNYGGNSDELNRIHEAYPDKLLMFTEASIGTWNNGRNLDSSLEDNMVNVGLNTVNKHCVAALVWNFMLDWNRGPNLDGGCQTCYGAIDIAMDYKSYTFNSHYYTIAHMSLAALPGAVRIDTEGWSRQGVTYAAFRNPDGTTGIAFYNANNQAITTNVYDGNYVYEIYLPARAAVSARMGLSGMDITENPSLGGYEMRPTGTDTYAGYCLLEQGKDYTLAGRSEDDNSGWYYDTDFFVCASEGALTFQAITGIYQIAADFGNKTFRIYATDAAGNPMTYRTATGLGTVWVIGGKGIGKPNYAQYGRDWQEGVNSCICMAPTGNKHYQMTLTVGQQLDPNNVNFKFFHQPGWGGEFNTTGDYRIRTDSDIFQVGTGNNNDGNIRLRNGKSLTAGDIYVFTLDCSDPRNAILTAEKSSSTGIASVTSDPAISSTIYNLQGQRLPQAPSKGIYIADRKIYISK